MRMRKCRVQAINFMGGIRPIRPIRLIVFLATVASLAQAEPSGPEVRLPITGVTVYEDRALVRRSGEAEVEAGVTVLRVGGLPVGLNETSLRASVPGGAAAKVLSVSTRTEEKLETQDERLKALEKEEEDLQRKVRQLSTRSAVLDDQERYLQAFERLILKGLSERTTLGTVQAAELKETGDFLSARRVKASEERRKMAAENEELAEKLQEARKKIDQMAAPARKTVRFADVILESAGKGRVALGVSYLINEAEWRPRYEARLTGGKLEMHTMGEVRQATGEAWENVDLVLSTARPSLGSTRPQLMPIGLTFVEAVTGKQVVSTGMPTGAPAEAPLAGEGLPTELPAPSPEEAAVRESGTSVVFQVPGKSSVPSDRRSHKLPVISFRDDAPALSFETTPKALRYVYLKGKTTNKTQFPMLPGPVDIFRESGFMGTSTLSFTAPGKNLELSFGIDEDIKVQRRPDPERTRVNVSGRKKEHRYAFDTEVANYKEAKLSVLVVDNFPVSDIEEVSVRLDSSTTPSAVKDEKTGRLEWSLELEPGKKKSVHLEYGVTMPKDFTWQAMGEEVAATPTR